MADIDMEHVRKLVLIDEVLNRGLRNWHMHARIYPGCDPIFDNWLDGLLERMADNTASLGEVATGQIPTAEACGLAGWSPNPRSAF